MKGFGFSRMPLALVAAVFFEQARREGLCLGRGGQTEGVEAEEVLV